MKSKLLLALTVLLSCFQMQGQEKAGLSATDNPADAGRFVIFYADWDSWGHGSSCRGWGLCNYSDCWFCEVSDKHRAKATVDKQTKMGELCIELDPAQPDEKKAIAGKLAFTIEDDIVKKISVLHKGSYAFDPTVGKYGGYRLKISLK